MGKIDKEKYYCMISERIRYALHELGYTQAELVKLCQEQGYDIKQSSISKITSSATGLSIMNVVGISKVLNLDLSEVLSTESNTVLTLPQRKIERESSNYFITRADDKVFEPYLGTYVCYFYPTKSSENRLIKGEFSFSKSVDSSECEVKISFKTGKKNEENEEIRKEYSGTACISLSMNTIYCSVSNKDIGEICYIVFSFIPILYEKLECRLGGVLTSSAGDNRLPTMQRILLSKKELSDDMLYFLEGQLLMNQSEILLSQNAFNAMLKDDRFPDAFKEYFCDSESGNRFSNILPMPYFYLYESMIRDSFMSEEDKIKSICLLRKYSAAAKYNKVGGKADQIVYKFLTEIADKNNDDKKI